MKIKFCPTAYLLSLGLIAQPSFALMPYHVHFNNPPLRMKNHNNHSNWQKDLDAQDNSNLENVSSTNKINLHISQQDRKILKISNVNRTSQQDKKILKISNAHIQKYSDVLNGSHISPKTYKQIDNHCAWSDLIDVSEYDHNEDLKRDYDDNLSKDVEEYPIFPLFQYIKNFFLV